jgi:hypothetical protein
LVIKWPETETPIIDVDGDLKCLCRQIGRRNGKEIRSGESKGFEVLGTYIRFPLEFYPYLEKYKKKIIKIMVLFQR